MVSGVFGQCLQDNMLEAAWEARISSFWGVYRATGASRQSLQGN